MMREAFGIASVDWKEGINWANVRAWRLQRAREAMKRHELGAILTMYDENLRYISSTLTPGWNRLKPGLRYGILVEQSLGLALSLCDRISILGEEGRIAWEGTPADLDADGYTKEDLLGVP